MSWKALHPGHAIERTRMVVGLADALPTRFIKKMASELEGYRSKIGFTQIQMKEGHEIQFGPEGFQQPSGPASILGWDMVRLSGANLPVESVSLEAKSLTYETADYSRWTEFLDRYTEAVKPSLDLASSVASISKITLEYVDRFIYEGKPDEADPRTLLQGIDDWLPDGALSGQELWHIHRGWFEMNEGVRVLINHNLDAQDGLAADKSQLRSIQVFTKAEIQGILPDVEFDAIKPHLKIMHDRILEVFGSVLVKKMSEEVGNLHRLEKTR